MSRRRIISATLAAACLAFSAASGAAAQTVRIGDLGRFDGWRDNALIGYGLVTGLTGTGDSPRNPVTQQAISNAVGRLGANIDPADIRSRNVAAVMVTAVLPTATGAGDRIDVTVTSVGDARSLAGGVLLMTPLLAADQTPYALAQGALVVGGHQFSSQQNSEQRNFPSAGVITGGATVERGLANPQAGSSDMVFLLRRPDVGNAVKVADAVNAATSARAWVTDANRVQIDASAVPDRFRLLALIENTRITPEEAARIVVNERAGTVVAGAGVRISGVAISQGDIRVSVSQRNEASQPVVFGGLNDGVSSLIVANTRIDVTEGKDATMVFPSSTVGDLMEGLSRLGVDARGKISILQAVQAAGALHAEIVVQ
ncbi:flagellar basal body P-ring protein FlgI [Brevundimonas faecalis]|uniref:Flagellar P-ring protein n=1 Tax=Brevundimonas faecalis TaxID=947378 RepID=A0ABV2R7K4_9CAUL